MNVLLIDPVGNVKTAQVHPAMIRRGVRMALWRPYAVHHPGADPQPEFDTVDFIDSGYVDAEERTILTIEGELPRLEKSKTVAFKRGRELCAEVFISEQARLFARVQVADLAWEAAQATLQGLAGETRMVPVGTKVGRLDPQMAATRVVVYAEERLPA